ncbi:MAG: hypothetical protein WCV63_10775 [Negativicutes bacterium]|jgi:hypothetical protein
MKKLTIALIALTAALSLLGVSPALANMDGVYLPFDNRACFEMSVMNISPYDFTLMNRSDSEHDSATVFSPGIPKTFNAPNHGGRPANFAFLIQDYGTNLMHPVWRAYNSSDAAKSQDFAFQLDITAKPEDTGDSGFALAWKIIQTAVNACELIDPADIGAYTDLINNMSDLINWNPQNGFRAVANAVYCIPASTSGYKPLNPQGTNYKDFSTYLILNSAIGEDDQIVVQFTAYRTDGSKDNDVTIANGYPDSNEPALIGKQRQLSRIGATIMTYGQFRKTASTLLKTGKIPPKYAGWVKELNTPGSTKSTNSSSNGGLFQ